MRYFVTSFLSLSLWCSAPIALADDVEDIVELREETRCFAAKGIRDFMKRFDGLDDTKTDTLKAVFAANIDIRDEGSFPDRVYIKSGDDETNMPLDGEGVIQDFTQTVKTSPAEAELCIQDKARAGTPVNEPGAVLSLPLSVRMKNQSGRYDMAELQDGLKDGKSFYKKMVGGPAALLVPKMTHLVIAYDEDDVPLNLAVFKGDEPIDAPKVEPFNGAHVIRFKDLKKLDVTRIEISGGSHRISPAPSIETMKKFGFGGE